MRDLVRFSAMVLTTLAGLGLVTVGCPGTIPNKECFLQEERAFALLSASCLGGGCHSAEDKVYGLDFETRGIGARHTGQTSVDCDGKVVIEPGKPEESILYLKLFDPPPCGSRMPLARPELYPEDIELIRVWIAGMDGSCAEAGSGASGGAGGSGGGAGGASGGAGGAATTSEGGAGGSGGGT